MSKTPEEIKKGLEHCINGTSCRGCPYCEECAIASDCNPMHKDLQDYIQQLESDKQQLEGMLAHMNQLRDAAAGRALQMEERVHQLEAERDAAVADIRLAFTSYVGACQTCKHGVNQIDCRAPLLCGDCENEKCKCQSCDEYERNWEWRGVTKEAP